MAADEGRRTYRSAMTMPASEMTVSASSRRTNTLVVLGLALVARLFVVWHTLVRLPAGAFFTRGLEMDLLAKSLVAGKGLSSPFGPPTGPTAMMAPAYPLFVAGVFRFLGVDSLASSLAIMGVHTALGMVTAFLILYLGRRVAREDSAVLAAVVWSCALPVIWVPSILWETSFSTCLLIGFVALAFDLTETSSLGRWLVFGSLCAVAGLFNPALLPSLLAVGLWAAYRSRYGAWYKPLLALAVFGILFAPWPIRNARVFHTFIATRTTVGLELWMGNRPGATGYVDESLFPAYNAMELADYKQRGELGYFAHKGQLGREYVRAHPTRFIWMSIVRFKRFWTGTGNQTGHALFGWYATGTTLAGLLGLVFLLRSPRWNEAVFFLIPVMLFPLPYYITHAEFRYRLVLDPLLCVLGTYAVNQLAGRSESRGDAEDVSVLWEELGEAERPNH